MYVKITLIMFMFFPTSLGHLLLRFRLSKTLLEDVWDALRLLSGVA